MKLRSVDTAFWADPFVESLDPIEKLIFLYLITNPLTTLSGIYEISTRRIANETGIDRDMVTKLLQRFSDAGKVYYYSNHIILVNYQSHQKYNPMMQKNVVDQMSKLPEDVLAFVNQLGDKTQKMTEVLKVKEENEDKQQEDLKQRIIRFTLEARAVNDKEQILPDDEENDFIAHWTAHNNGDNKFWAEKQKSFYMSRRMHNWKRIGEKKRENVFKDKPHTGRVVGKKEDEAFKRLMEENKKKVEKSGVYNPNNDPEFLKIMQRSF